LILDEIQKVPSLLDEVHWLIENKSIIFGLCGSSARKLKREHANLLGGRASRYELFGFSAHELKDAFNLHKIINHGYLPRHYLSSHPIRLFRSYVNDYLKEEVREEGLVRNLPAFSRFLETAAITDAELVNYVNIASDCGVSSPVAKEYFQILVDTLLGTYVPAYIRQAKRRVIQSPKFYFSDVGVVNFLTKRHNLEVGSSLFGKAFENWVLHELCAHREYSELFYDISYWRLASGIEVDFIINDMHFAVECKATKNIHNDHLKGLRQVIIDHPHIHKRILVCLESKPRKTDDGIEILPHTTFIEELWNNALFEF